MATAASQLAQAPGEWYHARHPHLCTLKTHVCEKGTTYFTQKVNAVTDPMGTPTALRSMKHMPPAPGPQSSAPSNLMIWVLLLIGSETFGKGPSPYLGHSIIIQYDTHTRLALCSTLRSDATGPML